MKNMKQGYKQTDFGVIPEDWEIKQIGDLTTAIAGGTPSTSMPEYWGGNIPWMSSGELNNRRIHSVVGRITQKGLERSSTHIIPEMCVLIGLAGQGKTRGTVAINYISLCTNQSIAAILPNEQFDTEFLYQNLYSRYDELRELSSGEGGRGGLNLKLIKSLYVSFPPLPEQRRIAEALSDVDELIYSLEKLIKKKKAIKQGVMQELLTGKRRLPGFTEGWDRINLGNLCNITTGKKDANEGNENGQYPFFTCSKEVLASNEFSFEGEAILVAGNGDVGNTHYYNGRFEAYQRTYVLMDFTVNIHYVLYFINQFLISNLTNNSFGSSIPYIVKKQLSGFQIDLPKYSLEINAIVDCIHSMENEILAMTSQLKKYKTIKSGMMSELLTGRIRLV